MRVPTRQLEQYGDKYGFTDAVKRFASACIRKSKGYHETFLVNLHHLNNEIGKTRRKGKYVRGTLVIVRQSLFDSPCFKLVRQHSAYVFEIKILPLCECQKNVGNTEKATRPNVVEKTQNTDYESKIEDESERTGIEPQQLISVDQKCKSAGIVFQKQDLWKVARYPSELIDLSINCFKATELTQSTHIRNPAGWLIDCLKRKYYLSFRPEKIAKSVTQTFLDAKEWLISNFGSLPTRSDREIDFCFQKKM